MGAFSYSVGGQVFRKPGVFSKEFFFGLPIVIFEFEISWSGVMGAPLLLTSQKAPDLSGHYSRDSSECQHYAPAE